MKYNIIWLNCKGKRKQNLIEASDSLVAIKMLKSDNNVKGIISLYRIKEVK
jgi:hypothetical protein